MAGITKVNLIQLKAPNRVGLGADVLEAVASVRANIVALNAWEEGKPPQGVFLIDTSNNAKAKQALRKAKFAVEDLPSFKVQIPNRPGMLAELVRKVADAKIDIGGAFSVASGGSAIVYVRTAADARAIGAMKVSSKKTDTNTSTTKKSAKKAVAGKKTAAKKTATK
jgi:hypothetical protein